MKRPMTWLFLGTAALTGCTGADAPGPAPQAKPIEVTAAKPTRRDVAREITLPVELWAWQRVSVVAKVSGYIGNVSVDRGSIVKAGDVLTTVAVPELEDERRKREADVKVAEAGVASAIANQELQSITAHRMTALVAERAVSVQEADEARARELVAKAVVEEARSKLVSARENLTSTVTWLAYGTIAAPFSGVVTERWVHPGAFVSAAERTPIFEIVDHSTIRAVVDVPEVDSPKVHAGRTAARVVIPELPGGPRVGIVSRSATSLDPKTRTLRVEIDLPNPRGELLPGMFGQAAVVLEAHESVLAVPSTAVASNGDPSVFVVIDNRTKRKPVRLGLDDGKFVEITGGLDEGDLVVAQARGVGDGAAVQVLDGEKKEKR